MKETLSTAPTLAQRRFMRHAVKIVLPAVEKSLATRGIFYDQELFAMEMELEVDRDEPWMTPTEVEHRLRTMAAFLELIAVKNPNPAHGQRQRIRKLIRRQTEELRSYRPYDRRPLPQALQAAIGDAIAIYGDPDRPKRTYKRR